MAIEIRERSDFFRPYYMKVITGPMFSGKTEELRDIFTKLILTKNYDILALKPKTDTRNERFKFPIEWESFSDPSEIFDKAKYADVVVLDELNLMNGDRGLVKVALDLRNIGKQVIVAGLNLDYSGKPFEIMSEFLSYANDVKILEAICDTCGKSASYSQRIIKSKEKILVGGKESYEARCFEHHVLNGYKD